jgi:elongation factor P
MLQYNEIKPRKYIVYNNEPHEVLSSHVFRKQQRKPVNQTKLKNLISGKVFDYSFHQSEKVAEADLDSKNLTYLYTNKGMWWFSETGNPSNRFELTEDMLEGQFKFLKENTEVSGILFNDKMVSIKVPIKMQFKVVEAPPNIRGNTSSGGDKKVVIETGAVVTTPLFIETGDTIEVNTETGEYVQRAS